MKKVEPYLKHILQEFCRKPRPCRAGMNARVETENQV
jgi:hypothetical protein